MKGDVNRRALLYFLLIPTFLLYALALTGCLSASPGIPNLFLVQVTAMGSKNTLKVGYFGKCRNAKRTVCTPIAGLSEEALARKLFPGSQPTKLIHFGLVLSSKIFLPVIAGAGVVFTLGVLSFSVVHLRTKSASRLSTALHGVKAAALALLALSCVLCFGAAISITMAIAAFQFSAEDNPANYQVVGGKPLQALQWAAFAISVLITLGLRDVMQPIQSGVSGQVSSTLPKAPVPISSASAAAPARQAPQQGAVAVNF
ncbi:hypothetical protein BDW59DRAFT_178154 [Aspergillus cavernicola]|uniref:SUR7/PalI family-domain-containing protein n=1 Tax=Aspergillus cavernicola TaxID=176166 RepID=A0ABR4HG62_9EURO